MTKHLRWLNIYKNSNNEIELGEYLFHSYEEAVTSGYTMPDYYKTIEIVYEEDENERVDIPPLMLYKESNK